MFRLASKVQFASKRLLQVRRYSEGFDLSKYLNRIEAISKTKPAPRQSKSQARPGANLRAKTGGQERTKSSRPAQRRPSSQQQSQRATRRPQGQVSPEGVTTKGTAFPRSGGSKESANSTQASARPSRVPKRTTSTPAADQTVNEWASLDSVATASKPLPRSSRRQNFRKPGSKSKVTAKGKKGARKPLDSSEKRSQKSTAAPEQYKPFLTPDQALEVVFRNEGTSAGGFIGPIDVSLSALQPNFVESAVSYNSRVRSLLNSVPANVHQDREKLELLVNKYVSGSYFNLDSGETLSSQALAHALNANRSVPVSQKQFLAQVAAGKISPKQIAASA